jgi:hypothetical protein
LPIKKTKSPQQSGQIRSVAVADECIRFSFRFFDGEDEHICPLTFRDGYTRKLVERMKDISTMSVREFTSNKNKSLRAHTHEWANTKRPNGFTGLNEQFKAYPGWQFELSANEHGRVHGIMIDSTFYVIWLDHDHVLYS